MPTHWGQMATPYRGLMRTYSGWMKSTENHPKCAWFSFFTWFSPDFLMKGLFEFQGKTTWNSFHWIITWKSPHHLKTAASGNEKCDFLHHLLINFKSDSTFAISERVSNFDGISNSSKNGNSPLPIWSISWTSHSFLSPLSPKGLNAIKYPWGCMQGGLVGGLGVGRGTWSGQGAQGVEHQRQCQVTSGCSLMGWGKQCEIISSHMTA